MEHFSLSASVGRKGRKRSVAAIADNKRNEHPSLEKRYDRKEGREHTLL
jgi:hypothetical protein